MEKRTIIFAILFTVILASGIYFSIDDSEPMTEGDINKSHLSDKLESMRKAEVGYPTRLLVLGNADLDDDLDADDIIKIENLILNGYDYVNDYFADANYDGIIDQDDVDYLNRLINFEDMMVYYLNVDFQIAFYNKSYPLNLANTLTQTLEMECILCPDNIVATDERCYKGGSMGKFYTEFESVIDYSKTLCIGSHKTPNIETFASVAMKNNGYLTVWMNSQYTYNTGYIDNMYRGTSVQIVRLPSWEMASTISGILTAGYLFDKPGNNTAWDNAVAFTAWYDNIDSQIKAIADSIPDNEKKKVISASLSSDVDNLYINGSMAGEHLNLVRIGINDVTSDYFRDNGISGTWYASLSKERVASFYQTYGLDVIAGTIAAPYNANMNDLISAYNARIGQVSTMEGVSLLTTGWIMGSGPSELIFCIIVGKAVYPELYKDFDLRSITNEFLQYLGTYGTGEGQWTYDSLDLFYNGGA